MRERSRARGWALQTLYAWESKGGGADTLVPILEQLGEQLRISSRNRAYADVLVRLVARNLDGIDRTVRGHLTNWSMERLSVVDRNILRLGVAELAFVDDVPAKVTLREMIHLAERYSTPESPRFVNGVLDAAMRTLEAGGSARKK